MKYVQVDSYGACLHNKVIKSFFLVAILNHIYLRTHVNLLKLINVNLNESTLPLFFISELKEFECHFYNIDDNWDHGP